VLSRRSWTVPASALPRGRDDAGLALEFARWRRTHNLPRLVFVTPVDEPGADRPGARAKPRHVDLDHVGSLALLADLADGTDALTFTEMLPAPDQLWLRDGAGTYVTELIVELTRTRRTP
jgi:hypothetical protein